MRCPLLHINNRPYTNCNQNLKMKILTSKCLLQKAFMLFVLVSISVTAYAQKGTVSGNIVDAETGEELIGATVQIQGAGTGTVTDISGNYQLQLDPGTYTLQYSYVSYSPKTVEGVEVEAGEVKRIDISLQSDDVQLQEVVVQAEQINNNEVALLKLQQKSFAVQDGISIGEIRRIGASNSAEAMKNVTGASVEDGKYVVMRGLGDRYSNTQMNGVTMPSTNPYRNSASLDMIPSTMIENVVTTKTFTPDQPGNFAGGNVNVTTKSIPDQFYLSASVSAGYNTNAAFAEDFLTDPVSGRLDWLGYTGASRELTDFLADPQNRNILSLNSLVRDARSAGESPANIAARNSITESVNDLQSRSFLPVRNESLMNHSLRLSLGNRARIGNGNFGYNLALNYTRDYINYTNRILNLWEFPGDPSLGQLQQEFNTSGIQSSDSPQLGGLLGLAYQFNNRNEIAFNYTYNNSLELSSGVLNGVWPGAISGNHTVTTRNISPLQRTVNNLQLTGKHSFVNQAAKLDWVLGYTNSIQDEPDVRVFANELTNQGYSIDDAEYDRPFHFFRNLEDVQFSGKIDLEIPIGTEGKNKIKTGISARRKGRDFSELRFQHDIGQLRRSEYLTFEEANGDFDAFFAPSNYGILGQNNNGTYQIGPYFIDQTLPSNIYTGEEQVLAAYAMGILQATDKLKLIGGVRAEKTDFEVETENPNDPVGSIDELDFLPSLNAVYALNDKANLRAAGSQTLARPNMREIAPFSSFDFIGGFIYLGNPNLDRSKIWNVDLRYELFPTPGELFAISAFYKNFDDPIQQRITPNVSGSVNEISFVNVDKGILYGFELEFRKNLGFMGSAAIFDNLKFTTNFTFTQSFVDLDQQELEARRSRNPNIEDTRPFQAQSPYILNVNLNYYNPESEFEATIYMNMYGRRLYANGNGGVPDIYELNGTGNSPIPDLRFIVSKRLFENFSVGFRAENLLNYKLTRNVEFQGSYFVQEQFDPGRTFTLTLGYTVGQ